MEVEEKCEKRSFMVSAVHQLLERLNEGE